MIGIRREDKNQWERRAALTPDHVTELTRRGVEVRIEPSAKRAFPDVDYERAGAQVDGDLSPCNVVFGVKEIPQEQFKRGQTYFFFSHTTKAQAYNMPMLRRLMELGCTLVDYELIVDDEQRRLIFFGRHAGYAGMIDSLWALGRRLDQEGFTTPLERVRLAHDYSSLDEATNHISRLGEQIRHEGLPEGLYPLVCGFTGSGNVSTGAQEIWDRLPVLEVRPDELAELANDTERPRNVLYKVRFGRRHRVRRREVGPVRLKELASHPELYESRMPEYLPYLTMLINGIYWDPAQPRLVSKENLRALWADGATPRLRLIADITFDIEGSIEATVQATTPDNPTYLWDVDRSEALDAMTGRGPLVVAVENLPCQLPAESSQHFGDTLVRFVPKIARCDWSRPLDALELPPELTRAIIVHRGELTPDFRYLEPHVRD